MSRALFLPGSGVSAAQNLAVSSAGAPPTGADFDDLAETARPGSPITLEPISLSGSGAGGYDEDWLQELLFAHPSLIPVDRIEAGAGDVLPLCRELPIARPGGVVFLDMLGVTRTGRLVLVECKLWRNPQARREVVAQILEYAGLMRGWTYGDLTAKLKQRFGWAGANPIFEHARSLWPNLEEAGFVDRVSRSLDAADFHLIIAGDGIRSDIQVLARQINDAGSRARLSLVEIQIWRAASGETVILPWLPAKTELIEQRVIVAADTGRQLPMQEVKVDDPTIGTPNKRDPADGELADRSISPERAASAERIRQFWNRFMQTARFDHPEQTPPIYGGLNWVKIALGAGYRLNAFRQKGEELMGVYMPLNLKKDGDLVAMFEAELDGMREESNLDLRFAPITKEGYVDLLVSHPTTGRSDDEQLEWLIDASNRMVTLLRPKLSAWERDARDREMAMTNA